MRKPFPNYSKWHSSLFTCILRCLLIAIFYKTHTDSQLNIQLTSSYEENRKKLCSVVTMKRVKLLIQIGCFCVSYWKMQCVYCLCVSLHDLDARNESKNDSINERVRHRVDQMIRYTLMLVVFLVDTLVFHS